MCGSVCICLIHGERKTEGWFWLLFASKNKKIASKNTLCVWKAFLFSYFLKSSINFHLKTLIFHNTFCFLIMHWPNFENKRIFFIVKLIIKKKVFCDFFDNFHFCKFNRAIYFVFFTSDHQSFCRLFKFRLHGIGCIYHDIVSSNFQATY